MSPVNLEKIVSLCKRRGFVFPGSEIYGGIQGFYDYGPLGVEMKNNLKALWWGEMTRKHDKIVGIDGTIITHPRVWQASGHVDSFNEPLAECLACHRRFSLEKFSQGVCPDCGGKLGEGKKFNLLVETSIGSVEGDKEKVYLRGEACQTIYLDYQNVLDSMHWPIPFGICQIGKAFRNEITIKQFIFRTREFEQWDLQWFVNPKDMDHWYGYWKEERMKFYHNLLNHKEKIRFYQHSKKELAHYAQKAFDIQYETPWGWEEWEGIHWRGDWDLRRHGEYSGKDFTYTDQVTGEKFLPWIVETSGGVDRTFLYLLLDAYEEADDRVVLHLSPQIAPYKVAVFPLLRNKPELVALAKKVFAPLKKNFNTAWDERGNIGKRYYAQDEIGTPWCVTVDFQSLTDQTVTVRERDTMKQERVPAAKLENYFREKLK
ncbi:MAG: glycine--tRNA ligase [Candidatus Shapirobacteria bacterium]